MHMPGNILDFNPFIDAGMDKFLCLPDNLIIFICCGFLSGGIFWGGVAVHCVDEFGKLTEGIDEPSADLGELSKLVQILGCGDFCDFVVREIRKFLFHLVK